jgi:hypothetical protein
MGHSIYYRLERLPLPDLMTVAGKVAARRCYVADGPNGPCLVRHEPDVESEAVATELRLRAADVAVYVNALAGIQVMPWLVRKVPLDVAELFMLKMKMLQRERLSRGLLCP